MNDASNAREQMCNDIRANRDHFTAVQEEQRARALHLANDIDRLKAEIQDEERKLDPVVAILLQAFGSAGSAVAEAQRLAIETRISMLEARLAPLEHDLAEAQRLSENATYHIEDQNREFARHSCADFGYY